MAAPSVAVGPGFRETVAVDDETQLVGVKWNGAPDPEFTLQVQEEDGSWTEAYAAEPLDTGPDPGSVDARSIAARRGSDYLTEPISVLDPNAIRVQVNGGTATDVEFVTVGGGPAEPTGEPGPPVPEAPEPPPPGQGEPSPATPTADDPPSSLVPGSDAVPGAAAVEASLLSWAGGGLLAFSAVGALLTGRRRVRLRGSLVIVAVVAVLAAACVPPPSPPATPLPAPGIQPRSAWGGPNAGACAGYTNVRFAVVHHTGGGPQDNTYADGAAKVRSIYQYHVTSGGYCDIAYNFLVDKWGNLWEGRAGGIDNAVMGAHTLNYNSESTGIAIMGDFTSVNASAAAQDALVRLIAWKFKTHNVSPAASVYKNGAWISPVSAHRELVPTACPGNSFFPEMGRLRSEITARAS